LADAVIKNYVGKSLDNYVTFPNLRTVIEIGILKKLALSGVGCVQLHNNTNEGLEGFLVNLVAFIDIDGAPEGFRLVEQVRWLIQ
jgi:hypothetical protein